MHSLSTFAKSRISPTSRYTQVQSVVSRLDSSELTYMALVTVQAEHDVYTKHDDIMQAPNANEDAHQDGNLIVMLAALHCIEDETVLTIKINGLLVMQPTIS